MQPIKDLAIDLAALHGADRLALAARLILGATGSPEWRDVAYAMHETAQASPHCTDRDELC